MAAGSSSEVTTAQGGAAAGEVLGRRALNRAFLARQLLLDRSTLSAVQAIEHLVGMQAQAPNPPYIGLWTRLEGFHHSELSGLMQERQAVRIALMRSTIHLVSARDCLALRPILQPVLERGFYGNSTYGRGAKGMDMAALAAAGRALVEERPRTFNELGALLREQWPDRDPATLAMAIRTLLPLVQVPPRGLWGASGQATHTSAESWLGGSLASNAAPDQMVLRYLAAFGPASVADVQTWSGLSGLRAVVERLRPHLLTFRDEHGRELFDLPEAPRPDPETPAPPRFLPEFDNMLLSHADRTRIMADEHRKAIFTVNGLISSTILVDGFVGGTWKITRDRRAATLVVRPFAPLPAPLRAAVAAEGARLLAFATPEAGSHDVQFAPLE